MYAIVPRPNSPRADTESNPCWGRVLGYPRPICNPPPLHHDHKVHTYLIGLAITANKANSNLHGTHCQAFTPGGWRQVHSDQRHRVHLFSSPSQQFTLPNDDMTGLPFHPAMQREPTVPAVNSVTVCITNHTHYLCRTYRPAIAKLSCESRCTLVPRLP